MLERIFVECSIFIKLANFLCATISHRGACIKFPNDLILCVNKHRYKRQHTQIYSSDTISICNCVESLHEIYVCEKRNHYIHKEKGGWKEKNEQQNSVDTHKLERSSHT